MNEIIQSLNEVFAVKDAEVLANNLRHHEECKASLKAYMVSDEYKKDSKELGLWGHYAKMHSMCGGKTWFAVYREKNLVEFVTKNLEIANEKRNVKIAKKLLEQEILSVEGIKILFQGAIGFQLHAVLDTPKGKKTLTIDTVYAGGHNIQCLHQRTTVRVK